MKVPWSWFILGPWKPSWSLTAKSTTKTSKRSSAKRLAEKFITIIPDDPEIYQEEVDAWDGEAPLVITHQDDDFFFFSAVHTHQEIHHTTGSSLKHFNKFVSENSLEDES